MKTDKKVLSYDTIPGYSITYKYWSLARPRILPFLNILTFIPVVIINILSGSTNLIGGYRTGEISDMYPSLFTPAGYAFGIWGVIYTLLSLFLVVQVPAIFTGYDSIKIFEKVGFLFILSNALNFTWIFLWSYQKITAAAVIITLFAANLIIIHMRLGTNYSAANRSNWNLPPRDAPYTIKEKVFNWLKFISEFFITQMAFSIYTGWLTAATIANISAAAAPSLGSREAEWAIAMLTATTVPAFIALRYNKDIFYSAVIFWAVLAIGIKQQANQVVFTAAIVNCTLVGIGIVWTCLELIVEFIKEKFEIIKDLYKPKEYALEEKKENPAVQQVTQQTAPVESV